MLDLHKPFTAMLMFHSKWIPINSACLEVEEGTAGLLEGLVSNFNRGRRLINCARSIALFFSSPHWNSWTPASSKRRIICTSLLVYGMFFCTDYTLYVIRIVDSIELLNLKKKSSTEINVLMANPHNWWWGQSLHVFFDQSVSIGTSQSFRLDMKPYSIGRARINPFWYG